MNEFETEDQQVEALKKWWKENGASLILGLIIGVTGLFGWRYYLDYKQVHAVEASNLYMQVLNSSSINSVNDQIIDIQNQLINQYADTPYAALAALALARTEYEKNNIDAAVSQLELAIKYAGDEIIEQLASLRLASIYIEQEKYTPAAELLNAPHDEAFDARYEELRGDLYLAQGDTAGARVAYDKAIALYGPGVSKWLKLKRQDLGETEETSAMTPDSQGAS